MHNLHPGANLHPEWIFGHVDGVLKICTRDSDTNRVWFSCQI